MKLESDSEIENDLKEVLTAGGRAKDLVKQILAFSRQTQKEKMPVQKGTTFNPYFSIISGKAKEKPEEYTIIPIGTERILVVAVKVSGVYL